MTTTAPKGYDWSTSKTAQRYTAMRDALLALRTQWPSKGATERAADEVLEVLRS